MENTTPVEIATQTYNPIRPLVRGAYDMQHLRIQTGNRLTSNFKSKLGMRQDGMSEKELEKEDKRMLDRLREDYNRITDGIIEEGKLPSVKKFKGGELISDYAELVLVEQYMSLLRAEERQFDSLVKVMTGIPIYDDFLKDCRGVGPAMAGVLLSEIDITKAEYSSSLWKLAGLDVITLGRYVNANGDTKIVPAREIEAHFDLTPDAKFLAEGKYEVEFFTEGRSRKEHALVDRPYVNKDGKDATRRSITFNPFLKTKLIGVLGTSFLRSTNYTVDGKRMGAAKRLELAKAEGFKGDAENDNDIAAFLRIQGHVVINDPGPYASAYYEYRSRLDNHPRHAEKSDLHKHNMSVRYSVKIFLIDLYKKWRALENLPVAMPYAEAKLGLTHGVATASKVSQRYA